MCRIALASKSTQQQIYQGPRTATSLIRIIVSSSDSKPSLKLTHCSVCVVKSAVSGERYLALRQMHCRVWCLLTLLISLLHVGVGYLFRNRNYESLEKEEYEAARAAQKSAKAASEAQACAAPQERPMATFRATKTGTITLPKEADLHKYLTSEVARPALLFADCYEKLSANKFRCEIEPIKFFSTYIIPILEMSLDLRPEESLALVEAVSGGVRTASGAEQAATKGMGFSHGGKVNEESFKMTTYTKVTWASESNETYSVTSEQNMQISMEKPAWLMVPSSMFNKGGDMILSQVLKKAVPDYLEGLQKGFAAWSAGKKPALKAA